METKFEQYRKHWTNRFKEYELRKEERFVELSQISYKLAEFLYNEYNVDKVYLFGSLVNNNTFGLDSDIDLAVQGLPENLLYRVHGLLSSIALPYKVDLILIEECHDYIKDRITKGGKLIAKQR
ncbi:MAG TPA: nucleotidyltransferase domain-containing protein [Spirochaetia bacterium]|nr:nucleotidyltransferase domain-containing protein [Spirochaetia bacterium]